MRLRVDVTAVGRSCGAVRRHHGEHSRHPHRKRIVRRRHLRHLIHASSGGTQAGHGGTTLPRVFGCLHGCSDHRCLVLLLGKGNAIIGILKMVRHEQSTVRGKLTLVAAFASLLGSSAPFEPSAPSAFATCTSAAWDP